MSIHRLVFLVQLAGFCFCRWPNYMWSDSLFTNMNVWRGTEQVYSFLFLNTTNTGRQVLLSVDTSPFRVPEVRFAFGCVTDNAIFSSLVVYCSLQNVYVCLFVCLSVCLFISLFISVYSFIHCFIDLLILFINVFFIKDYEKN